MPFGLFKESQHPRGPDGKFASGGGGSASPQKPPQSVPAQTRTSTNPKPKGPTASHAAHRNEQPAPTNPKQQKLAAQKELISAKHRELGMKAAAENQKRHPSKGKINKLMKQQQKLGQQAKAIQAKQMTAKAQEAKRAAKQAGKKDLKTRLASTTAQQKAIGAQIQVEQQKRHPNTLKINHLNRKSAKLSEQAKKINRKGSREALRNAKEKVKAANRAAWQSRRAKFK